MAKKRVVKKSAPENNVEETIQDSVADFELDDEKSENIEFNGPEKEMTRNSSGWTSYCLADLEEDEKFDGNPKTDGLRRLVEKYVGPIVNTELQVINCPKNGYNAEDPSNCATVVCKISLHNEKRGVIESYSSSADASNLSCTHPFNRFLTSIAETRALGRCYRMALRLKNVVTSDELPLGIQNDMPEKPDSLQIKRINEICKKLDINVQKIFFIVTKKELTGIKQYNKSDATECLQKLSEIENKMEKNPGAIPKTVTGFDPAWQDYFN